MSLYVLVVYSYFFLIHVRPSLIRFLNCRPLTFKPCPELQANNVEDAFNIFSENLRHPNKKVRLVTLRILCHFETLSFVEERPPMKKMKTEVIQNSSSEENVSEYLSFCFPKSLLSKTD